MQAINIIKVGKSNRAIADVKLGTIGRWIVIRSGVGLGCLGVTCSPQDPRFAGSNLAEVDRFLRT